MKKLSACSALKSLANNNWARGLLYLTVATVTIPELIWTGMFLMTAF